MSALNSYVDHYTLGAYAEWVTDRRLVATAPVWMLDIAQPAGDFPDPAVPELVLQRDMGRLRATVDLGAGRFRMQPGQTIAAPPGSAASFTVDVAHHIQVLSVPAYQLAAWVEGDGVSSAGVDLGRLHASGFRNDVIHALMDRLWDEAGESTRTSRLVADAALLTLWAELLREARLPLAAATRGGLATWQTQRCIDYLEAHLAEDVGIEQLAALVGLSPFHFARAFKRSTGMPPHRFQTRRRIARAKTLLASPGASVTSTALAVGYDSSQALARAFRSEVGCSPSEYQRRLAR